MSDHASPQRPGSAVQAALIMLLSCAFIAGTTLLAKALGLGTDGPRLHPLQVSAGRFVFAFLILLPFVAWLRPSFLGAAWATHLGRSLCGWAGVSCLFAAAALMPLASATAIGFLSPMVTMMLAIPLLGERVGPWRWGAAAAAFAGAMVLIRPGTEAFQPVAVIALLAAAFMGMEAILIKRLSVSEPPLRILTVNNAMGASIAACAAAFVWTEPTARQWFTAAALGGMMVSAQALFIQAMRRADASFAIPFFYATLVFAALYDFVVFGDLPDAYAFAGAGMIVGGALVLAWRERRHGGTPAAALPAAVPPAGERGPET